MRVNANALDKDRYIVTLNGVDVPFCVEADDEAGYVIVDVAQKIPDDVPVHIHEATSCDGLNRTAWVALPAISIAPEVWETWLLSHDEVLQNLKIEGVVTIREITP